MPWVKYRACNQLRHIEKVCKNKTNQQEQQVRVVKHHQENEDQLFKASYYLACSNNETWLIDSGSKLIKCTISYHSGSKLMIVEMRGKKYIEAANFEGCKVTMHEEKNIIKKVVGRAGNELNQLENSLKLDSTINSLNLVHEPNELNLSLKWSSLTKRAELELYIVRLVWFMSWVDNIYPLKYTYVCIESRKVFCEYSQL